MRTPRIVAIQSNTPYRDSFPHNCQGVSGCRQLVIAAMRLAGTAVVALSEAPVSREVSLLRYVGKCISRRYPTGFPEAFFAFVEYTEYPVICPLKPGWGAYGKPLPDISNSTVWAWIARTAKWRAVWAGRGITAAVSRSAHALGGQPLLHAD
jgi:hypothetical protein